MSDWKLHLPDEDNLFQVYRCGPVAGQRVVLRKDLPVQDDTGKLVRTQLKGEVWEVLPGIRSDPVVWLRQPDGRRHTWDDDAQSVAEWFEVIDDGSQDA